MARILLAEDDNAMRQWLVKALVQAGHDVVDCSNGKDALLQIHKTKNFDLLLTDIVMPGVDGIELAKRTQGLIPNIKTMFITGFSGMNVGTSEKDTHTHYTMAKPFHLRDMVKQVETILNG
ncbi:MAG: response regulator [Alphaproteobacteria bacterium]|nr:MAG: response regulator [Alphaproteobacteria bacterium]